MTTTHDIDGSIWLELFEPTVTVYFYAGAPDRALVLEAPNRITEMYGHMDPISPDVLAALFIAFAATLPPPEESGETEIDVISVVARAQKGDREAVGILYRLNVHAIHRYIAARVGDAEDTEDLTAEVFVNMVKGLPTYHQNGAIFSAWLYKIAAARVADYYRRRARTAQDHDLNDVQDPRLLPEEAVLQKQMVDQLRGALNELTEEQQTILILRFVERKSHEEVSAIVGKSVTAVKSIQHRALISLTELLGSEEKVRHYLRGARG